MKIFDSRVIIFFRSVRVIVLFLFLESCSLEHLYSLSHVRKNYEFEQVDFKNMVERYLQKEQPTDKPIEGIYSVSILVTKKYKPILSSTYKEKVLDQRQNYTTVALIKENNKNTGREYIEIPVDKDRLPSYSIRGEFSASPEGGILIYKHFEKKSKTISYTFSSDSGSDLLEGVRTENKGSSVITHKLTYLRLFPKRAPI